MDLQLRDLELAEDVGLIVVAYLKHPEHEHSHEPHVVSSARCAWRHALRAYEGYDDNLVRCDSCGTFRISAEVELAGHDEGLPLYVCKRRLSAFVCTSH